MSQLKQLLSAIRLQDFPHKSELPDSLDAWKCTLVTDPNIGDEAIDASQLLGIYKRRYEHLSKITSAHAQTLAKDIEWFCSNLEKKSLRQIATDVARPGRKIAQRNAVAASVGSR